MIAPDWFDVVQRSNLFLASPLIQTQWPPGLVHSICSTSKFALRQELFWRLVRRSILGRGPVCAHKVAVSESLEISPLLVLDGNIVIISSILLSSSFFWWFLYPISDLTAHALDILPIIWVTSGSPILSFNTRNLRSQHLNLAITLIPLKLIDIFECSFGGLRYWSWKGRILECLIEFLLAHSEFLTILVTRLIRSWLSCYWCIESGVEDALRFYVELWGLEICLLLLGNFLNICRLPTPGLLLFALLDSLKAIEEFIEYLGVACDIFHVMLQLLALVVLHLKLFPLCRIADCKYLLLQCLGLCAEHLLLFMLDHVEYTFLHEANAFTRILLHLCLLNQFLQLIIHF